MLFLENPFPVSYEPACACFYILCWSNVPLLGSCRFDKTFFNLNVFLHFPPQAFGLALMRNRPYQEEEIKAKQNEGREMLSEGLPWISNHPTEKLLKWKEKWMLSQMESISQSKTKTAPKNWCGIGSSSSSFPGILKWIIYLTLIASKTHLHFLTKNQKKIISKDRMFVSVLQISIHTHCPHCFSILCELFINTLSFLLVVFINMQLLKRPVANYCSSETREVTEIEF